MTHALDLLVTGGVVVDDRAERPAEIGVRGGRIVAVAAPGTFSPKEAARTVDAAGRYVMPGGVDAHVHFSFGLPPILSQSYEVGSQAALYGGSTTVLDFAFRAPGAGAPLEAIAAKRAEADGHMDCDYGLHLLLAGEIGDGDLEQIRPSSPPACRARRSS